MTGRSATGTPDVVIVGGGAIGSAIACFLAGDAGFGGRVTVVERDPSYGRASSALSAASIRQQFSTPENIAMSRFSFAWLRDAAGHLAVGDEAGPDVGLHESGYLYLAPPGAEAVLRELHDTQRAEGADVVLLDPGQLARRFDWLSVDGVALGSLGLRGEGWFDGYALLRALRRKAIDLGATYVTAEVVDLHLADRGPQARVDAAILDDGRLLAAGTFVDAAGPWAAEVAAMAGIDLPVEAHRRTVHVFEAPVGLADCPLVIDTSGAWFRPEGDAFIGAPPPDPAEDRAGLPLQPDAGAFEARLWPLLAARVPAFDQLRARRAWAGYYEVNTFDRNALLGPHPRVPNLLFANGFSGHGIQHAPAVGRAIAELVVHGRYVTLDLSVLGPERIEAGRPVVERNVIG